MKLASNLGRSMSRAMVYKGVSMVLSLVYVPIVLNYLGDYKYGVWASILNILSWISYFDLGIGNGLRNRLSESLASSTPRISPKVLVSSAYAMRLLPTYAVLSSLSLTGRRCYPLGMSTRVCCALWS